MIPLEATNPLSLTMAILKMNITNSRQAGQNICPCPASSGMKLRTAILGIICTAGMLLSPSMAFAALDLVTFRTDPEMPGPNQTVTVSIQSYAVDLNSARSTWYIDGVVVKDGVAEKSIETRTKEFGQIVTIDVVIITASGTRYDKQLLLRPLEVDILWEADTFVPPFYKGKALPTYKSNVKVTAIPRFNSLSSDPSLFSYTWTANQTQGVGGGLGKMSALVPMKYSGSTVPISVRVSDPSEGGQSVTVGQDITAVDPLLIFYEEAPLLGIHFNKILTGNTNTAGTSFRIHAVPYFFSNDDIKNGDLSYLWQNNTLRLTPSLVPTTFLVEKTGTNAQSNSISLKAQNRKRILQIAETKLTVDFSSEQ